MADGGSWGGKDKQSRFRCFSARTSNQKDRPALAATRVLSGEAGETYCAPEYTVCTLALYRTMLCRIWFSEDIAHL